MRISPEQLHAFIEIYRKKYGVTLSNKEAYEVVFWMMALLEKTYGDKQ
jgi:hypothetical protein